MDETVTESFIEKWNERFSTTVHKVDVDLPF